MLGLASGLLETRTKTRIYRWFLLTSFLAFISVASFFIISRLQETITNRRAEQIILALEKNRIEYNQYPDNLNLLEKNYLNQVPSTAFGVLRQDFGYTKTAPDEYKLHYFTCFGVEHYYNSKTKKWHADD